MKHPFQIVLTNKEGNILFVAVKNHIQVFDLKTGALIGSWIDNVDSSINLKKQQQAKIEVLKKEAEESSSKQSSEEPESKRQKTEKKIKIPKIPTPGPGAPPIYNYIRGLRLSNNEKYLIGMTDVDKAAVIFEIDVTSTQNVIKLIKRQGFSKRPCALTTTGDDTSFILADKFGDVYALSIGEPVVEEFGKLEPILGHVSMLSDVIMAKKDSGREFILTADRDEHIRISNYPKAYVINKWLFGHHEFISNLVIPSWNKDLLISAGGDDFVCLWNWCSDKDNLLDKVQIRELAQPFLNDNHLPPERFLTEQSVEEISISKIVTYAPHELVIFVLEQTKALLVYQVKDGKLVFKKIIEASNQIVDVTVADNGKLVVSLDVEDNKLLEIYEIKDENTIELADAQVLIETISNQNDCDVDERKEFYPLYHAYSLRKRSEH